MEPNLTPLIEKFLGFRSDIPHVEMLRQCLIPVVEYAATNISDDLMLSTTLGAVRALYVSIQHDAQAVESQLAARREEMRDRALSAEARMSIAERSKASPFQTILEEGMSENGLDVGTHLKAEEAFRESLKQSANLIDMKEVG